MKNKILALFLSCGIVGILIGIGILVSKYPTTVLGLLCTLGIGAGIILLAREIENILNDG